MGDEKGYSSVRRGLNIHDTTSITRNLPQRKDLSLIMLLDLLTVRRLRSQYQVDSDRELLIVATNAEIV
jgi:hypothetical protein